jgi:SAM-dependent methyltransferase
MPSIAQDKQEREREFHNRAFAEGTRHSAGTFYSIVRDSRRAFEGHLLSDCAGREVLEYGCGSGAESIALAKAGARVTGIDISDVAIAQAAGLAARNGLAIRYQRMDAERLEFPANSFDIVYGVAILHHLDLDRAFASIAQVLRPGGRAVFIEPLGHNPAINLYRRLTPHMRTEDEHPLRMRDLAVANRYFGQVQHQFFNLSSLLAVPFRNTRGLNPLLDVLNGMDRLLFAVCPPARRYAWQVVSVFEQPRKTRAVAAS